jgi:hypothetical protein
MEYLSQTIHRPKKSEQVSRADAVGKASHAVRDLSDKSQAL